jgi:hypothetical protein
MLLVDDHRVLDQRRQRLDSPFDERLLVLGVLVFGVLGDVAVFLGVVDSTRDFGSTDVDELVELFPDLLQPFFR